MASERCDRCRYFIRWDDMSQTERAGEGHWYTDPELPGTVGRCRRLPPAVANTSTWLYPRVGFGGWCGEWKPRD